MTTINRSKLEFLTGGPLVCKKYIRHIITPPDVYTRTYVLASPVAGPAAATAAAAAVPLLAPCVRSKKTQKNERKSVVTGCAPRCIADREVAAAQQQQQRRRWPAAAAAVASSSGQLPFGVSGWLLYCASLPSVCVPCRCVCILVVPGCLGCAVRPRDKARSI